MADRLLDREASIDKRSLSTHGKCFRLKKFPYRQETDQLYAIKRSAQRRKMWSRIRNPFRACNQGKSVMITMFCWSGLVFTIGALTVSFYKDSHDESEQSIETIFDLSVAELVLALVAVFITLAKQTTLAKQVEETSADLERHQDNKLFSSRGDVSVVMPNDDEDDLDDDRGILPCFNFRSTTSRFLIMALLGWLTSSIVMIGSFVGFYVSDRGSHSYLKQMKYTTSLVLFMSIICDGIITEIFHEALSHAKVDVCRLVALQLKAELFHELTQQGRDVRVETLEKYLSSTKQFADHKLDHIVQCDNIFVFSKDRLAVDSHSKPKFENIKIDRSPQTELRMATLMNREQSDDATSHNGRPLSLHVVKTSNDTEECVVLETKPIHDDDESDGETESNA